MILVKVPWLPSAKRNFTTWAITIAPFVFVRTDKADDPALIAHEQKHLDQIKEAGWLSWYWRYITRPAFRKAQEAEGYAVQHGYHGA